MKLCRAVTDQDLACFSRKTGHVRGSEVHPHKLVLCVFDPCGFRIANSSAGIFTMLA